MKTTLKNIISKYYPSGGSTECQKHIKNKSISQIQYLARKYGIKILDRKALKKSEHAKKPTIFDPRFFIETVTPESAYIFGLLWADGFTGNPTNCSIKIEIIEEDLQELKPIFDSTGKWKYYRRQRQTWKPVGTGCINNRKLFEFLVENNYQNKSGGSANNILNHIPTNLHHYFFRGLIDGDGCFYFHKKQYLHQFSVSSTFDQDWGYFTDFLIKNDILNFSISRRTRLNPKTNKENSHSVLRISSRSEVIKLGEIIYKDYELSPIGLTRKYKKFLEIVKA